MPVQNCDPEKKPEKPIRIVVLGREETKFWIQAKKGVDLAAEQLKNFNVDVEWIVPEEHKKTGKYSVEVFGPIIDQLIQERCDGMAVVASDKNLVPDPSITRLVVNAVTVPVNELDRGTVSVAVNVN